MDMQHKKLFDLIHQLYTALQPGTANEHAVAILQDLSEYTRNRFTDENQFRELSLLKKHPSGIHAGYLMKGLRRRRPPCARVDRHPCE